MERENELKEIVAENIVKYRKINNMTQLQFAEKLDYTDKAVSKWERGESIPDLFILMKIVDMFGITLNDLVTKQEEIKPKLNKKKVNKLLISVLSVGLTWLVATVVFSFLMIFKVRYQNWMVFIYALPVSSIVATVFACIWGRYRYQLYAISSIYYTVSTAVFLQAILITKDPGCWFVFLIIAPMQILTILWYGLKKNKGYKNKAKDPAYKDVE